MADKITEGDIVEVRYLDIYEESEWISLETARTKSAPTGKVQGQLVSQDDKSLLLAKMIIVVDGKVEMSYIIIPTKVITSMRLLEEAEIDDFKD
jgi:hypothetical protein